LNARNTLYLGLILCITGGGLLFAFFWLLAGRVGQLIEWHQEALNHLTTRDGLTGLFNPVTFYTMLEDEVARSQRSETPVSLLMIDLDHFKVINDKFGHTAGDTVLKEFGKIIHRQSRSIDKVCRFGGEEIAVILPETNATGAMIAGERMRTTIEQHLFKLQEGQDLPITVSIGVATVPEHGASAQELVNATDRALYVAKERGRNQVYRYNS
jgi:two-component system, cell cycle response regulator